MTENIIYKLLDTNSFVLKVNEQLPKYSLIKEFLLNKQIPFVTWNPEYHLPIEIFEMAFSASCNFQDIYILAHILKEFGLDQIYPSKKQESQISIGTYLNKVPKMEMYALAMPISIESLLQIDPKTPTQTVIDTYFENNFGKNETKNHYGTMLTYNNDYERDTFDAMTDGQLGDWDDFEGNIDDVFTWSGRD